VKGKAMVRSLCFVVVTFFIVNFGFAQGINGKWKGEMQSPNGAMELTFTFNTSGDSLTGTVEGPMGEIPITNGKVDSTTFTFDVNVNEMIISHECTVMSDSISMKITGMPGDAPAIILKRVHETDNKSK
jgi:hypothetical protein